MSTTVSTDLIRNGVDTGQLFATLDAIDAQPELGRFQFRITNQWIAGAHNTGTIREFYGPHDLLHDVARRDHAAGRGPLATR